VLEEILTVENAEDRKEISLTATIPLSFLFSLRIRALR
jgi:hypothetical protein